MSGVILWNVMGVSIFVLFAYNVIAAEVLSESESETNEYDSFEQPRIWSTMLEDMTINSSNIRDGRVLQQQQPYKYIPTSNVYINRRIDNVAPLGASALKQNINFNGATSSGSNAPASNQFFGNRITQTGQEISETDLYLLTAIEKLVYRVDYMERRLHKTEQIVYYLMAGNNQHQKEIPEKPCAMNFTRIGDNCYLFVSNQPSNWKSASSICRSYGAHLAELETLAENEEVVAYLLNHQQAVSGSGNFWLGGLNPGLLWIWSTSARPVNPNVNLTQIHNSTQSSPSTNKISQKINNSKPVNNKKGSNNTSGTSEKKPLDKKDKLVVNKTETDQYKIEGEGRCLGLTYRGDKHAYKFYGLDCTSRQRFICELPQDHIDNEIDRIAKKLFN